MREVVNGKIPKSNLIERIYAGGVLKSGVSQKWFITVKLHTAT